MTEEQAKTKWCPMFHIDASVAHVAVANMQYRNNCAGSGCMMWRWNEAYKANGTPNPEPVQSPHGYCGMAGKPFPAVVAA